LFRAFPLRRRRPEPRRSASAPLRLRPSGLVDSRAAAHGGGPGTPKLRLPVPPGLNKGSLTFPRSAVASSCRCFVGVATLSGPSDLLRTVNGKSSGCAREATFRTLRAGNAAAGKASCRHKCLSCRTLAVLRCGCRIVDGRQHGAASNAPGVREALRSVRCNRQAGWAKAGSAGTGLSTGMAEPQFLFNGFDSSHRARRIVTTIRPGGLRR